MAQHKQTVVVVEIPAWVDAETNPCVRTAAEDLYYAKALAIHHGAPHTESCAQLMRAAEKSLRGFENRSATPNARCSAADRATRRFWEAKVCARRTP